MEVQAKDRAAIDRLQREAACSAKRASRYGCRALDEITAAVFRFDALLDTDPNDARPRLRRWPPDGQVRVARTADWFEVKGVINPLALSTEAKTRTSPATCPKVEFVSRGGCHGTSIYWTA